MNRAMRILAILGVAAVTAVVGAGCASEPNSGGNDVVDGLTSVTAVGGGASLSYTVPQLIDSMDAGRANGLNVIYKGTGTSSSNMIAAVLSGDADFAFPATTTAIDAIQEGANLVIVGGGLESASTLGLRTDAI